MLLSNSQTPTPGEEVWIGEARKALYPQGFSIGQKIGGGGFASIYLAKNRNYQDEQFCVKVMDIGEDAPPAQMITYCAECETLVKLSHPNVIQVYSYFTSENYSYMVLEYCPGGSLKDYLDKYGPLPPSFLYPLTKQTLEALSFCHQNKIAHRDIKPSNILIDKYGRAKLADFGLSIQMNADCNDKIKQFAGSKYYMAPEQINKQPFDPLLADIWAAGVTFFELAVGGLPWEVGTIPNIVEVFKTTKPPADVSPVYFQMISKMMQVDPRKRTSFADILKLDIFLVESGNMRKRSYLKDPVSMRSNKNQSMNNLSLMHPSSRILPISGRKYNQMNLSPTFKDID